MTDIVKGVLVGAWTLIIGWILPAALGLSFLGAMVLPSLERVPLLERLAAANASGQALLLLVGAVILGLTLSSLSTPLYRFLEGYTLWPTKLQEKRIANHLERRAELRRKIHHPSDPSQPLPLKESLALEEFHRYPDSDAQVAPTRLGNAIRRLEYYSFDRYCLDSQLLWSQLRGSAPEAATKEVDNARAGVDFFVCLIYVSGTVAACAIAAMFSRSADYVTLSITIGVAIVVALGSYSGAVNATDAWSSATKAMIDLGRLPLAKALGLELPESLHDERDMWLKVGWFLAFSYHHKGEKQLDCFRLRQASTGDRKPERGTE